MALYANTSSINANGTWNVVDATTYLAAETGSEVLTTAYSGTRSSGTTPGAITVSHIGVKLSVRTGTTGTMSVELYNNTLAAAVAGTEVTIDCADLPVCTTAGADGGWIFFKLSSPVLLLAATSYSVEAKTSSASQVSLFRDGTADNISRALITTATGTPGAGDDMIITGEYTGAGTSNSYTVTWNITATTDYGSTPTAANSLLTPGIALCSKGTWLLQSTAATNYNLKISNSIIQYVGSTWNEQTIPRDSSFTLQWDCGANVDYGFVGRGACTNNRQGQSRTSAKLIDRCYLNTDEAANSTSLGVDTDTGWLDNDVIAIASTTRTATQCESGTLNGNAGASSLTVDGFAGAGGGLLNAHSGTSPTQAEVILLTRNTVWKGASASLQGYVSFQATSVVDWDWYELMWMGSNTATKRGFETACTTGTQTYDYGSHHDFGVSGSRGFSATGTSGTGITITNLVTYNIANEHFVNVATTGSQTVSGLWSMLNTTASTIMMSLADAGINLSDVLAIGATGVGISQTEVGKLGTWSNIRAHSCTSYNIEFTSGFGFIDGMTSYRGNGNGGLAVNGGTNGAIDIEIEDLLEFGSSTQNVRLTVGTLQLNNPILAGDTTFSTANGISNQGNSSNAGLRIYNGQLGVVSGIYTAHTTSDIAVGAQGRYRVYLNHTILASSTEVNTPTSLSVGTYIASDNHDQVSGAHKTLSRYGIIEKETTIVRSGTSSLKMTPNSASFKLTSDGWKGGWAVQVASGQTCTFNVYVAQGQTYNGGRVRLILKRNDAIGISSETLIDTATSASDYSGGHQWELLTGTTSAVTADGTVEFYIDCDGTVGSVYADDWTASVA